MYHRSNVVFLLVTLHIHRVVATLLLPYDVTPEEVEVAERACSLYRHVVTGCEADFGEAHHVRDKFAARIDAEDSIVLDVFDFVHTEVTLAASTESFEDLSIAVSSTDFRLFSCDCSVADLD